MLGTLVLQGTDGDAAHARASALQADDTVEREVRLARMETARAGLAAVDRAQGSDEMVALLRRKYEARVARAESGRAAETAEREGVTPFSAALREAQAAERQVLLRLRASGAIGDDAFHRVEEELDWAEVNAQAYRTMQS